MTTLWRAAIRERITSSGSSLGAAQTLRETIEDGIYGYHLPDESIRARAEQQAGEAIGQDAYDDALDSRRAFDVTETVLFARATANVHHTQPHSRP
jgi:hypothetical protein